MLASLGIEAVARRSFRLADGRIVNYHVGQARVRLEGEDLVVLVVLAPERAIPLLGASTLETFGLGVGPQSKRLISVPGLRMGT